MLSGFGVDDFVFFISFVSDEDLGDILGSMLLDLLHPVGNVGKRFFLSAVIDEDDAHGSLVIGLSDRSESFLASRVPHLELDDLSLNVDGLDLEVDS